MGRACMQLWTDVHYVLKVIVLILIIIVEFIVFEWSMQSYWRLIHLEGHYLASLSYVVIILYGYTWFNSTPALEMSMVIVTIFMFLLSIVMFFHEYYDRTFGTNDYVVVYRYDRRKFAVFVALTIVCTIILIVDFILLLLKAIGKKSSRSRNTRQQQHQQPQDDE